MKNVKIMIMFLTIGIVGCSTKTEPSEPVRPIKVVNNISDHTLYHTGTITDIHYYEDGYKDFFKNVQYNFKDGSVIFMDRVKCDHLPKIGEYGKLYVTNTWKQYFNNYNYIQNADYLWMKDETVKKVIEPIETHVVKISTVEKKETLKEYKWTDANYSSPNVYQLVLIKLDDKVITTGRLDENEEWKIETDKKRSKFNKYPSFKVVEWKELNIK